MPLKETVEPQPFVKWAGGKRWLAAHVDKIKPKGWTGRYFEPFVGGGALFFALKPKRATLSDANEELITTYLAIRDNRKDGLRDMCELVERETEDLALRGVRKGFLKMGEGDIQGMEWSQQIDTLASVHAHNAGKKIIIENSFKNDLHSFRGARNLIDHKVATKREDKKRELQFQERMMQGPRLIAELQSLKRKTH